MVDQLPGWKANLLTRAGRKARRTIPYFLLGDYRPAPPPFIDEGDLTPKQPQTLILDAVGP
jgi:hypothetical protein